MRICIVGDTSGNIDEGMKKIAHNIHRELSKHDDVIIVNPLEAFSSRFWNKLREFAPELIHYIPGPSIYSFALLKMMSKTRPCTRTVASATMPQLSRVSTRLVAFAKPNVILTQSLDVEMAFRQCGMRTIFFPVSGVDTLTFKPLPIEAIPQLRRKYGVGLDKFIVLHVGHIKHGRNIQLLARIQKMPGVQVLIVGSTSTRMDKDLKNHLVQDGCQVISDYISNIEEVYAIADCYAFPVVNKYNSIAVPLSVLEAMATNLPIISTSYGALPRLFTEKQGYHFGDTVEDMLRCVSEVRNSHQDVNTREMVEPYSWVNVSARLKEIYTSEMTGGRHQ